MEDKNGKLTLNAASRSVDVGGKRMRLKPREFELLSFLAAHRGQIFSREQLLSRVWRRDRTVKTRTVEVHVRWLRMKIESDPSHPVYIETIWGVGYRLNPDIF